MIAMFISDGMDDHGDEMWGRCTSFLVDEDMHGLFVCLSCFFRESVRLVSVIIIRVIFAEMLLVPS